MSNKTLTIIAFASCMILCLNGCGGGNDSDASSHQTHSEDDGHDHGSSEGNAHSKEDGHGHGDELHELGSVTVNGSTLSVTVGHIEAGSEVDVELARTAGTVPAEIRVWVGPESGIGSMKVKADAHGDHFHAHVELPEELSADAQLWIQVASAAGVTETLGLDIPKDEHGE